MNGTLLKENAIPVPYMNFTQFWKIYDNSDVEVDPSDKYFLELTRFKRVG